VFTRSGSTWAQQGEKLMGGEEQGDAGFGKSVALSGDGSTALVGGWYDGNGGGDHLGAAWVFTSSGSTWTQQGQKLAVTGGNYFGESVALSGNGATALIGSPIYEYSPEHNGTGIGAAWVFARSGTEWTQQQKLQGAGEVGYGSFGYGVALSADGSAALIGGPGDGNQGSGAAWVFVSEKAPIVVTGAASAVSRSSATLNAAVNPNGKAVSDCHFEYGTTTSYGASMPCAELPGSGEAPIAVSAAVGSLGEDTSYHFRIVATNEGGTTYGADATFTTLPPPPAVLEVDPSSGPEAGGTSVTITGTSLRSTSAVKFGSTDATSFTVNSDTSITAVSPAGTGPVDVTVTTRGGTSATGPADEFAYLPIPTVSNLSPGGGPEVGGTSVTITGTNLNAASAVRFGSTDATSFTVDSPTSITAISPAGTGTVDVTVTTPEGTSPTTASDRFAYVPAPSVASVSPNSGPEGGGTSVTISGSNLNGASAVDFGAATATSVKVNSPTSITALSPAGTGTVDVTVTTVGGTSATSPADEFRYLAAPEYGRCLKVAKGAGRFANGTCTKAGGTNTYEWFPAVGGPNPLVKPRFTATIKPLMEAKLYISGKHTISCTGEAGGGEYTGAKAIANIAVAFTGCHLDTAGGSCQSLDAASGEVVLNTLQGELGVIATSTEGPLKNKIGIALRPASGTVVAAFACASTPVLVTGSVIGEVPRDAMAVSAVVKFVSSTKGAQKPARFEGGEEDVLQTKLGEVAPAEQTGLKLTMSQTSEEKVEVNSVV
jgi:hypothetical protein